MDRACSLPSVLAATRLKFLAWGLLRSCVGCLLYRALRAVILACNARDRAYRSVNSIGCGSHSFVGGMRVHVERSFYAFVTDRACERFDIHSVPQSLRCEGMAERVERYVFALGSLEDRRKLLSA